MQYIPLLGDRASKAWQSVDLTRVIEHDFENEYDFKDLVAKAMVYNHILSIKGAKLVDLTNFSHKEYDIERDNFGVVVSKAADEDNPYWQRPLDFCYQANGLTHLVQVKHGDLSRLSGKKRVDHCKQLVSEILGVDEVHMTIATYLRPNQGFLNSFHENGVNLLNLGYNNKEFKKFCKHHYDVLMQYR